ncbi:MAG: DUF3035 domain-containing protein [Pseudomonadota bacterium]
MTAIRLLILGLSVLTVGACSRGEPRLLNLGRDGGPGPDEFAVLPTEPLEIPEDLTSLPTPNPGGPNRTDPDPEAQVAEALGGNVNRAGGASVGFVSHVTRFGIEAEIRQTLAAEDLEFRQRNNGLLLERLFNVNLYHRAYEPVSLDQYAELARLRRLGVRTPSAPPEGTQQ